MSLTMPHSDSILPALRPRPFLWILVLPALALLAGGVLGGWRMFHARRDFALRDVRSAWSPEEGLEKGEGWMQVNLPKNRRIKVCFAVPRDAATGKLPSSASNLLFWSPYLGEERDIQKNGLHEWAKEYARQCGWTVFTFAAEDGGRVDGKPRSYYIYPESGWHEVVFAVKAALEKRYGLTSRKLLVVGESSGGSLAEHLVAAHPEAIAAAAWSGGTAYMPMPFHDVPCGFFNNWGCPGVPVSHELYEQGIGQGLPLLWTELPPKIDEELYHHGPTELTAAIKRAFLKGVMELADPATGAVPPMESWPYSFEMPDGRIVHLPSLELLRLWERLPHRLTHAVLSRQETGFVAATEPVETPAKAALLFHSGQEDPFLQDAVQMLCQANCAVHVVFCGGSCEQSIVDGMAALAALKRDSRLATLPLAVLASGNAADAALQVAENAGDTLAGVFLYDPRSSLPDRRLPSCPGGFLHGTPVRRFLPDDSPDDSFTGIPAERIPAAAIPENQWLDYIRSVIHALQSQASAELHEKRKGG